MRICFVEKLVTTSYLSKSQCMDDRDVEVSSNGTKIHRRPNHFEDKVAPTGPFEFVLFYNNTHFLIQFFILK